MAINIRRRFTIEPGTITETELADNAVTEAKIKDAEISQNKIKDLAIKTSHLQDNLVTLAKADNDIRLNTYVGDETEVSSHDETDVKELNFPVSSGSFKPTKIRILTSIKTDTEGTTTSLKIYLDEEEVPRLTLTSTSLTYELKSGEFDVSTLANGKHHVRVSLASDISASLGYNDLVDFMLIS